ncbi:YoaK family protein [Sphingomonas abietis]|uniref:YoaK family protein n=1 Tax=Sphingomonas abietis TaxID=3012344 RepID=A0ABY7NT10_9SPHN|nr:YoaK family protein [Sphingomonas abietis]WBO24272.1 YoaK family protein [Sphingomonas abietis]
MLIRQGNARDDRIDRRLASVLAAVAGGLNAAAFHAVGFFSANMTGNVSTLSSLIALGQWMHGLGYVTIVLTFVLGATISTLAVDAGLRRAITTIYARVVVAEGLLLIVLGVAEMGLDQERGVPLLILALSFLMGLQNAIVTHISDARIRTTHVSGMATDIGIEIAKLVGLRASVSEDGERRATATKLRLHVQTIACFLGGGVAGVLLYRALDSGMLLVASLPLFMVAIPPLLAPSMQPLRPKH